MVEVFECLVCLFPRLRRIWCTCAVCRQEHSIENQLPFLQYLVGQQRTVSSSCAGQPAQPALLVAPVSIGWLAGAEDLKCVATAVAAVMGNEEPGSVTLITTSDFTHAVCPRCGGSRVVGGMAALF